MKGKFSLVWRVVIALVLVLSFSLVTAVPAAATHTVTVSLTPAATGASVSEAKTLTVTYDSGDPINKVELWIPDGYTLTDVTAPAAWYVSTVLDKIIWSTIEPTAMIDGGVTGVASEDFELVVTTPSTGGDYEWDWKTTDTAAGSQEGTETQSVDANAPSIVHEVVAALQPLGAVTIEARIIDAEGNFDYAKVFYSIDAGSSWSEVKMIGPVEDVCTADIPGQANCITVWYYISALDTIGNEATDPDGAPVNYHSYHVDGEGPDITDLTPADAGATTEPLQPISCVITDPGYPETGIGVDVDSITMTVEGDSVIPVITGDNDIGYTVTYTPTEALPDLPEDVDVVVDVDDLLGNSTHEVWFFVVDSEPPTAVVDLTAELVFDGVLLKWTKSTDNVEVAFYNIYRDPPGFAEPIDTTTDTYYLDGKVYIGQTYSYMVTAVDVSGLESDPLKSNVVEEVLFEKPYLAIPYGIDLFSGWNLISLPLIPESTVIADVLSGLGEGWEEMVGVVWAYDAVTGKWTAWGPGAPDWALDLATMEDGKGYWLWCNAGHALLVNGGYEWLAGPEIPPVYPVVEGWNLIGFKTSDWDTSGKIDSSDSVQVSWYFNDLWAPLYLEKYEPFMPPFIFWARLVDLRVYDKPAEEFYSLGLGASMFPGKGYWFYFPEDGTIIPPQFNL